MSLSVSRSKRTLFSKEFVENDGKILKKFYKRSFLVCGASGLIASTFLDFLFAANSYLNLDIQLYALGRSREALEDRFSYALNDENFHIIQGDVLTFNHDGFLPKIDFILQAASPAHPVAYANTPVEVIETNFIGTKNMLELCKKHSARLLYISSSEIYGDSIQDDGNSEDEYGVINCLEARSCYPIGKLAAETLCVCYNNEYQTDALILRPCMIYGPSISLTNTRADAQFLKKCISGQDIIMKSMGEQVRSMCYVKDAVRAIIYVLLYGKRGEAYNLSNENSVATIRQYAEIMCQISNVNLVFDLPKEIEHKGYSKIKKAIIKNEKIKSLGWNARYSLKEGIIDMIGHYKKVCDDNKSV